MQCPQCADELPDDDMFCEACGAPLSSSAEPPACSCGARASEIDDDGYCSRCGRRARRPVTDHMEMALSVSCAAVSDRGLKHARNEDRFGVRQSGDGYALVVCDGVSSSRDSEQASSAVADVVSEILADALQSGPIVDGERAMRQAIAAGESALAAHPVRGGDDNPPSTTAVAALVADGWVTVGWVGDSRAYWIGPGGVRQLTSDHSWMNSVVSSGEMTAEEAAQRPEAHSITRWLGADAGENALADTAHFPMAGPGVLLLCTDGLWNYAATPEAIAERVHEANRDGAEALTVARDLVAFANSQGGHDNITAIVLRCGADTRVCSAETPLGDPDSSLPLPKTTGFALRLPVTTDWVFSPETSRLQSRDSTRALASQFDVGHASACRRAEARHLRVARTSRRKSPVRIGPGPPQVTSVHATSPQKVTNSYA
jgi:serine/threonine protein phosphatase PrpC